MKKYSGILFLFMVLFFSVVSALDLDVVKTNLIKQTDIQFELIKPTVLSSFSTDLDREKVRILDDVKTISVQSFFEQCFSSYYNLQSNILKDYSFLRTQDDSAQYAKEFGMLVTPIDQGISEYNDKYTELIKGLTGKVFADYQLHLTKLKQSLSSNEELLQSIQKKSTEISDFVFLYNNLQDRLSVLYATLYGDKKAVLALVDRAKNNLTDDLRQNLWIQADFVSSQHANFYYRFDQKQQLIQKYVDILYYDVDDYIDGKFATYYNVDTLNQLQRLYDTQVKKYLREDGYLNYRLINDDANLISLGSELPHLQALILSIDNSLKQLSGIQYQQVDALAKELELFYAKRRIELKEMFINEITAEYNNIRTVFTTQIEKYRGLIDRFMMMREFGYSGNALEILTKDANDLLASSVAVSLTDDVLYLISQLQFVKYGPMVADVDHDIYSDRLHIFAEQFKNDFLMNQSSEEFSRLLPQLKDYVVVKLQGENDDTKRYVLMKLQQWIELQMQ